MQKINKRITHELWVLFLMVEQVRCMPSTIASMKISFLKFRSRLFRIFRVILCHTIVLMRDSSDISCNISSPCFSAKNATVLAYLLESPQLDTKSVMCCFITIIYFRLLCQHFLHAKSCCCCCCCCCVCQGSNKEAAF